MLDKKIFEEYERIEDLIYEAAQELLKEINNIEPIDDYKHLSFDSIDEGYIEYTGECSWRYGGYESYEHSLPRKLLFDKEFKDNYIKELKEKISEKDRVKQEREEKQIQERLAKEKAQYEELKAKFEGDK